MLFNAVELFIPLLLASLGGLFSEKSGILNISLEGMLLVSAFGAFAGAELTGSVLIGIGVALIMSFILALLFALGSLWLKGNIYIVGLAINLLAYPISSSLSEWLFHQGGTLRAINFVAPTRNVFFAKETLPGPGLFQGHNLFLPLSLFLLLFSWYFFHRSHWGLRLSLCGAAPERLKQKGGNPKKEQLKALLWNAFFCGLGGAALSLPLESFVPSMSAGKGWIALVLIYLGRKKPAWIALVTFLFALLESFSIYAQGNTQIGTPLLLALPYLLTLLSLAVFREKRRLT